MSLYREKYDLPQNRQPAAVLQPSPSLAVRCVVSLAGAIGMLIIRVPGPELMTTGLEGREK